MGSATVPFIYPVPPLFQMEKMPDWSTVPTRELLALVTTILMVLSGRLGEFDPVAEPPQTTEEFEEVLVEDGPAEDGSLVEAPSEDGSLVMGPRPPPGPLPGRRSLPPPDLARPRSPSVPPMKRPRS